MDKKVMVYIYKNNGKDNSNHGVSSRVNETLLFAEGISDNEIRRICEEEGVDYKNALQIKTEKFSFGTYKHAVPVELKDRWSSLAVVLLGRAMLPLPECWVRMLQYLS